MVGWLSPAIDCRPGASEPRMHHLLRGGSLAPGSALPSVAPPRRLPCEGSFATARAYAPPAFPPQPCYIWRKRDLNSYSCDANTKDYRYPISPNKERGATYSAQALAKQGILIFTLWLANQSFLFLFYCLASQPKGAQFIKPLKK